MGNRDLAVEEAFAGAFSEGRPVPTGLAVGSFDESVSFRFLNLPSSLPACMATLTTLSHFWCTCFEASVPALSGETEGR